MKIGVDVSAINKNLAGIGRYTKEVLDRMIDSEHEWFLYFCDTNFVDSFDRANVNFRGIRSLRKFPKILGSQLIVPYFVGLDGLDLFWSPTHRLPNFLPDRVARVLTIHDLVWRHASDTMRPLNKLLDSTLMPKGVRVADRVIAVSQHTAQDLRNEFPAETGKIIAIPLGTTFLPDAGSSEYFASLNFQNPYFVFVGTLEPRKNLALLIEAYSKLSPELRDAASLVVVGGDGWGGVNVSAIANKFCVQNNVRVLGYVSETGLSALYSNALFLAMPSLYEGFGLPILEAMAKGIPVLTSNCSSMPEVAGSAAVYVDPLSSESIANGLFDLIQNRNLRNRLSREAIFNIARFDWAVTAKITLQVFEEAFEHRKLAARI